MTGDNFYSLALILLRLAEEDGNNDVQMRAIGAFEALLKAYVEGGAL